MRRPARGVGYTLYVAVTVLLGLEIALRLMFSDPNYYWNRRYLFTSEGSFINVSDKLWTYAPHRTLRSVAVYGFPGAGYLPAMHYRVEYDCLYPTNNLGLVQTTDVRSGESATLVLGDSFTEGQGGCPWFPKLEARLQSQRLLNGGLQGAGASQWKHLASHLRSLGIQFERILIVAISNDFKRDAFVWQESTLRCVNSFDCEPNSFWEAIRFGESTESLLERSRKRAEARLKEETWKRKVNEILQRLSYVYSYSSPIILSVLGRSQNQKGGEAWLHPEAAAAISSLREFDPKLRVILVPQRDEVATRRMNLDSRLVEGFLKKMSVPFEWCELTSAHYMPLDGHPNAAGYEVLSACVEERLRSGNE
jgi:hypothetical protein